MATSDGVNAEQIEYWNADEARHWVVHEAKYDAMLRPYADRLLAVAAIGRTEHVLDIGCGTGSTTVRGARAASAGDVLGVDISRHMIARARERAQEAGVTNVRFEVGDAQVEPFEPDRCDLAISRFGVMFFADPVAAFANIAVALRPGGRLTFVCWRELGDNEWILVPGMAAATQLPLPDLGEPGAPGPFALADADRVRDILSRAGFGNIGIEEVREPVLIGGHGGTVDEAAEFLRGTGFARRLFAEAAPDAIARAIDAVRDALAEYATTDGVSLGGAAWLVTAER